MARTSQIKAAREASPRRVEFPTPFFYTSKPITLVELRMRQFSGKIRAKANWWNKVQDTTIAAKWRDEMQQNDRTLVDKFWSGKDRFEIGDGEKKWPREPITDAQLDYVFDELKYEATRRNPETGIFVTSIPNVYESRSLVSPELKAQLVSGVSLLESVPEEEKDWHPGSNKQVHDLVHPSMYCLRIGESYFRKDDTNGAEAGVEKLTEEAYLARRPRLADSIHYHDWMISRKYQWLPTDFQVSKSGEVKALSYINNLHPTRHSALYPPIESIIGRFVPLFEQVLSDVLAGEKELAVKVDPFEWYQGVEYNEDEDGDEEAWEDEHKWPVIPDPKPFSAPESESRVEYSLLGRKVQIIVKLANIILTPENPQYPGGTWHVEGMENENIIATGLYYYACENLTESRLDFRTSLGDEDAAVDLPYEQSDHKGYVVTYGFGRDHHLNQVLGHIVAEEDKCVAFPNIYQHHVDRFELADPTKPGYRKILCFFLVNPEEPIMSTTDVAPQQEDWSMDELEKAPALGKLPRELFDMVAGYVKEGVISRQKAEEHRELLMQERSGFVRQHNETAFEVEFNMCEH